MAFDLEDLEDFGRFVKSHKRIVLFRDFSRGDHDPEAISVRHDVDHSAEQAVRFAEWENRKGIKASYFLLPTADYYKKDARDAAVALVKLGHEVGIHNDAFTTARGDIERALKLLREWADEMRSWGVSVAGCADHGGGEPNNTL